MTSDDTGVNAAVAALLDELVAEGVEVGIQVSAYHRGRRIVNAAAGRMAEGAPPVDDRTIFPIYSVIKGVIAVAAHIQAERGLLDIDAPIARYWPAFAAHGKETITLRDVFSHRAGVPQMPAGVTLDRLGDWAWMTAAIADLTPLHPSGAQSFYHGMTYGWLIGEVVRLTDPAGRPFERFVQEELCDPLGCDSLFLSVPDAVRGRVATLSGKLLPDDLPADTPIRIGIPQSVDLSPANFNRPDIQRAVVPAVGGYANADGPARVFAMLAGGGELDGVRLLSEATVAGLPTPRPGGDAPDPFLGGPARLSEGGYMLGGAKVAVGPHPDTMFSIGAGGSIAWADRRNGLAVALAHNRMYGHLPAEKDPQIRIGNLIRERLGIAD